MRAIKAVLFIISLCTVILLVNIMGGWDATIIVVLASIALLMSQAITA